MSKLPIMPSLNALHPRRGSHVYGALSAVALAATLVTGSGSFATAGATTLDDFEGDGEVSQTPAAALRNWDIITSVDLQTESYIQPLCHASGNCIDLVGSVGDNTGGIISKLSYPLHDYVVGFFLYGSGRDQTGAVVSSGGTTSRLQVSLGGTSIYANNHIASDFVQFVVLHVRSSGKLRFLGGGEVANIGPVVDNVLVVHANP
jgi:hypothetical protein